MRIFKPGFRPAAKRSRASLSRLCLAVRFSRLRSKRHIFQREIRSDARTRWTPDDSNFFLFSTLELLEIFGRKFVEFARGNVLLKLAVPSLPVIFDKPLAKARGASAPGQRTAARRLLMAS
jgi:hypothetical protein